MKPINDWAREIANKIKADAILRIGSPVETIAIALQEMRAECEKVAREHPPIIMGSYKGEEYRCDCPKKIADEIAKLGEE